MRYRIEYLSESTDECSVCKAVIREGSLFEVTEQAWQDANHVRDADGFQIRDLESDGRIVVLEAFGVSRVLH